jgi:hypothetical protein
MYTSTRILAEAGKVLLSPLLDGAQPAEELLRACAFDDLTTFPGSQLGQTLASVRLVWWCSLDGGTLAVFDG